MKLKNRYTGQIYRFIDRYWILLYLAGLYVVAIRLQPTYLNITLGLRGRNTEIIQEIMMVCLGTLATISLLQFFDRERHFRKTHYFQLLFAMPLVFALSSYHFANKTTYHLSNTNYYGVTFHSVLHVGQNGVSYQIYRCRFRNQLCRAYYRAPIALSATAFLDKYKVYKVRGVYCRYETDTECKVQINDGATYSAKFEYSSRHGKLYHCVYKNSELVSQTLPVAPNRVGVSYNWEDLHPDRVAYIGCDQNS